MNNKDNVGQKQAQPNQPMYVSGPTIQQGYFPQVEPFIVKTSESLPRIMEFASKSGFSLKAENGNNLEFVYIGISQPFGSNQPNIGPYPPNIGPHPSLFTIGANIPTALIIERLPCEKITDNSNKLEG